MIPRTLGFLLLLAAALGHFGLVLPARRELAAAQDEFARAREERHRLRLRVSDLARRQPARARVAAAPRDAGRGTSTGDVRRDVLRAVDRARLSDVKLAVSAGRAPVAARVHLTAGGRFADVVPLTGELVSGPPGLVLERVRLDPSEGRVFADVQAFRLGGPP